MHVFYKEIMYFTREIMYFVRKIMEFANMFLSVSTKNLTETMIHLKRSRQSIILIPRVLGVCGSVFYVSRESCKLFASLYDTYLDNFLPVRI